MFLMLEIIWGTIQAVIVLTLLIGGLTLFGILQYKVIKFLCNICGISLNGSSAKWGWNWYYDNTSLR